MDSFTSTLWPGPFIIEWVSGFFLVLKYIMKIPVFNANSIDPDQTPRSVASALGLHCLSMFFKWDAGHKWVK